MFKILKTLSCVTYVIIRREGKEGERKDGGEILKTMSCIHVPTNRTDLYPVTQI